MSRDRMWAMGAAAALALTLTAMGGVWLRRQAVERQLQREIGEALDRQDLPTVLRLLRIGANPRTQGCNFWWNTPLLLAVKSGDVAAVREILDYGADVNEEWPRFRTPLMGAATIGQTQIVKLLLARGGTGRDEALRLAARRGHHQIVRVLARSGSAGEGPPLSNPAQCPPRLSLP